MMIVFEKIAVVILLIEREYEKERDVLARPILTKILETILFVRRSCTNSIMHFSNLRKNCDCVTVMYMIFRFLYIKKKKPFYSLFR